MRLCSPQDIDTFGDRPLFDGEELANYELGAKISFADGRGQFNIAAFHAEIDDLQAVMLAGACSSRIVMNVPEAHSTGAEFELFVQPTDRFDFGISASYVESKVDSSIGTVITDGDRQPVVPEFSIAASATYAWPFTSTVDGFITGSYQHVGAATRRSRIRGRVLEHLTSVHSILWRVRPVQPVTAIQRSPISLSTR